MKKFMSFLLSLMMVFSFSIPVFANDPQNDTFLSTHLLNTSTMIQN